MFTTLSYQKRNVQFICTNLHLAGKVDNNSVTELIRGRLVMTWGQRDLRTFWVLSWPEYYILESGD